MKIAVIVWNDAAQDSENVISDVHDLDGINGLVHSQCLTCGYLLQNNKEQVAIARDFFFNHDQVRSRLLIPKKMIKRMMILDVGIESE